MGSLQGDISLWKLVVGRSWLCLLALPAGGGVMPSTCWRVHSRRGSGGLLRLGASGGEFSRRRRRASRLRIEPAVVAIPLDVTSDGEILLLSMLINITPGSVTIDLSDDRRTLYVHVMHMTTAEQTRREIKDGFERRVKLLFE